MATNDASDRNGTDQFNEKDLQELRESIPENFQDDPIFLYFRCRYEKRDKLKSFWDALNKRATNGKKVTHGKKVTDELVRIKTLRTTFAQREVDERLVEEKECARVIQSLTSKIESLKTSTERDGKTEEITNLQKKLEDLDRLRFLEKRANDLKEAIAKYTENGNVERGSGLIRATLAGLKVTKRDSDICEEKTKELESISKEIEEARWERATLSERLYEKRMGWRMYAESQAGEDAAQKTMKERRDTIGNGYNTERYEMQQKVRSKVGGRSWKSSVPQEPPQPTESARRETGASTGNPQSTTNATGDKGYGFKVYEINLRRKSPAQGLETGYGEYSLKTYPLNDVLSNGDGIKEPCAKDTIRYFHFPANNMLWVEEAITKYCGEERGTYNYRQASDYRKQSSNLLCREYWTGQEHGSISDPIHARHMRIYDSSKAGENLPANGIQNEQRSNSTANLSATSQRRASMTRMKSFAKTNNATNKATSNFVIFMPYMHWEIDKRRRKMAEVMKQSTLTYRKELREEFPHLNERFREQITDAVDKVRKKHISRVSTIPLDDAAAQNGKSKKKSPSKGSQGSTEDDKTKKRTPLGEYFLQVAQMYDAMDIEPDVRMLADQLHPKRSAGKHHRDPPLHGRRTLDQSYYWKVEDTKQRDEDQVVYRGTKAGKSIFRTTRVIMVDQLWLYILDNNTIITFFPRRWGKNKPDFSGVHRTIRSRLEHSLAGDIQSVHDLALLIMNQCSGVFFDRTRPTDARPPVLDIFADAIAFVSEMKTIAFESFWYHLRNLRLDDPNNTDIETIEAAARTYLDVNPEGLILREAHDIMDELRMMGRIFSQQLRVTTSFSKLLQELHEQESPPTEREWLQRLTRTLETMNTRQTGASTEEGHAFAPQLHSNDASSGSMKLITENTLYKAKNLVDDVESRQKELRDLEDTTKEVTDQLKELLELKQQQASIIEARAGLARAEESVTQGRAIMLFTVVTIVFLPLSFMSSVFGMNAIEFSGPNNAVMPLRHQFKIMFPVSVGIILLSFAIAFSTWIRSFVSLCAGVTWATLVEYTGILHLWRKCTGQGKHNASGLRQLKRNKLAELYGRQERKKLESIAQRVNEDLRAMSIEYRDSRGAVQVSSQSNGYLSGSLNSMANYSRHV